MRNMAIIAAVVSLLIAASTASAAPAPGDSIFQIVQQKLAEIKNIKASMDEKLAQKDKMIEGLRAELSTQKQLAEMSSEAAGISREEKTEIEKQFKGAVEQLSKALADKDAAQSRLSDIRTTSAANRNVAKQYAAYKKRTEVQLTDLKDQNLRFKQLLDQYQKQISTLETAAQNVKKKLEAAEAGRRFLDMGLKKINESMDEILKPGDESE